MIFKNIHLIRRRMAYYNRNNNNDNDFIDIVSIINTVFIVKYLRKRNEN